MENTKLKKALKALTDNQHWGTVKVRSANMEILNHYRRLNYLFGHFSSAAKKMVVQVR